MKVKNRLGEVREVYGESVLTASGRKVYLFEPNGWDFANDWEWVKEEKWVDVTAECVPDVGLCCTLLHHGQFVSTDGGYRIRKYGCSLRVEKKLQ